MRASETLRELGISMDTLGTSMYILGTSMDILRITLGTFGDIKPTAMDILGDLWGHLKGHPCIIIGKSILKQLG